MPIQRSVSYVIRLLNRFGTGNINNGRIVTARGEKPLNKRNGYYIYSDLHPSETVAYVSAPGYESAEITLGGNERYYDETGIIIVNLEPVPSIGGVLQPVKLKLPEGACQTGVKDFYYSVYPATAVTLLREIKKGDSLITVSRPNWMILEGQTLIIGGNSQAYRVARYESTAGAYRLETCVEEDFYPIGSRIDCCYACEADNEGTFRAFRHMIYSPPLCSVFYKADGKTVRGEISWV